jgi:hypothetical protein
MIIREFNEADISTLGKLAQCFDLEFNCCERIGGFNIDVFCEQLDLMKNMVRAWLYEDSNEVFAALVMLEFINPFSGLKALEEFFWYSIPKMRNRNNLRLIRCMEKYAQSNNIEYIAMSSMRDVNSDKLHSFYTRKGYKLNQSQYILTIGGRKHGK